MKIVSFVAVLLCGSVASFAAGETAYKALRVIGSQRGQDMLNRVIEVQGHAGTPQPEAWKVVLDDPTARGGVREIVVSKGRIASERTPVNVYTGVSGMMNFQKLNLDSAGAFAIAEKEAQKAHLGFDVVDYSLRSGESGRSPVWVLQLLDTSKHVAGTMSVTADTGVVVRSDLFGKQRDTVVQDVPDDHAIRDDVPPPPTDDAETTGEDGERRLRIGHRIKNGLNAAGATIEHFFTGQLDRGD